MTRFDEFYNKGRFVPSFEIFPPKTQEGIETLIGELGQLKAYDPAYISVTYGAMGSTQSLTRDLVLRISKELKMNTAFHFTCVGATRDSIKEYVEELKKEGVTLIVALRGDPPLGHSKFKASKDGFAYANELVTYLKSLGGFSLAVAGYPEGHVEAVSLEMDLENLKRKVDAGADVVITQLFFNNNDFYDFLDRATKIGIKTPIIPGVMPILNVNQVEKIASMCGAKLPQMLHQQLTQNKTDMVSMREIGIEYATEQCEDLKKNGALGIHFYTLNKAYSVSKILDALQ